MSGFNVQWAQLTENKSTDINITLTINSDLNLFNQASLGLIWVHDAAFLLATDQPKHAKVC